MIAQRYPKKRSGFIHIPYLPEQTLDKRNMPSMSQEMMVEAVTAAVEAIVESEDSGLISAAKALIASK